ncbi:unnamed protein product [Didymodactylos carnosus]|nr:unnamed protein product [Didymodactylos carnosus]CAF4070174.1 unnamed protein product [Didymodactylos carnosus]
MMPKPKTYCYKMLIHRPDSNTRNNQFRQNYPQKQNSSCCSQIQQQQNSFKIELASPIAIKHELTPLLPQNSHQTQRQMKQTVDENDRSNCPLSSCLSCYNNNPPSSLLIFKTHSKKYDPKYYKDIQAVTLKYTEDCQLARNRWMSQLTTSPDNPLLYINDGNHSQHN